MYSADDALEVLRRGSRARQKAATALNVASSRSHSIYAIAVSQQVHPPFPRPCSNFCFPKKPGRNGKDSTHFKEP